MNSTFLDDKPSRIKSERKRLGLTQEQAAEKCGILRQQWIRYEKGTSEFDGESLRKFGDAGANIGYILNGEKSNVRLIGQFENDSSNNAKELLELFNNMTPEKQAAIMQTAKLFASS